MRAARRPGSSAPRSSRPTRPPCPSATRLRTWPGAWACCAPRPAAAAQRAMLSELRRVVRPGGRIGLLVFLAVADQLDDPPQGNHFPSSGQLHDLFGQAGLEAVDVADFRDITRPPPDWTGPGRGRGARIAPPVRAHAGADGGRRAEQPDRQAAELGPAHLPGHPAPGVDLGPPEDGGHPHVAGGAAVPASACDDPRTRGPCGDGPPGLPGGQRAPDRDDRGSAARPVHRRVPDPAEHGQPAHAARLPRDARCWARSA